MDKAEVRRLFRRKPVEAEISAAIIENIRKCDYFLSTPLILTYMPLPDEPDLMALLKDDRPFAIPYITEDRIMGFSLYSGRLRKGAYGISEPEERCECEYPEGTVALIPALAFTKEGYRVGRGAGYYDRFLSVHRNICKIGIIPSERIVEIEDIQPHDIPMDAIITEKGFSPVLRS